MCELLFIDSERGLSMPHRYIWCIWTALFLLSFRLLPFSTELTKVCIFAVSLLDRRLRWVELRYTVRRNLISRNPEINKKKKKGEAAGVGTPACTYTNICQICCITSTLFRASLLENRLLWPCFEIERIISCPLFYFSDRLSPPLLKSALNLADSCSHFIPNPSSLAHSGIWNNQWWTS